MFNFLMNIILQKHDIFRARKKCFEVIPLHTLGLMSHNWRVHHGSSHRFVAPRMGTRAMRSSWSQDTLCSLRLTWKAFRLVGNSTSLATTTTTIWLLLFRKCSKPHFVVRCPDWLQSCRKLDKISNVFLKCFLRCK